MNKKYKPKDKGYLVTLRSVQNLLKDKQLNFASLGAYILFSFQADWDRRHPNYRAILLSDKELSVLWSYNESTVFRARKHLTSLGLLEEKDGTTYIKNLSMFDINTIKALVKHKIADVHTYYAKSETELAETLFGYEKMQED